MSRVETWLGRETEPGRERARLRVGSGAHDLLAHVLGMASSDSLHPWLVVQWASWDRENSCYNRCLSFRIQSNIEFLYRCLSFLEGVIASFHRYPLQALIGISEIVNRHFVALSVVHGWFGRIISAAFEKPCHDLFG